MREVTYTLTCDVCFKLLSHQKYVYAASMPRPLETHAHIVGQYDMCEKCEKEVSDAVAKVRVEKAKAAL